MAIEIMDLPIVSMVIFHSYVSLPEGIWVNYTGWWFQTWIYEYTAWWSTPMYQGP